ncbi:carbon monoxide dehydrogenase accessory protein CooC [soil metagenome]|nr:AAA family ATPase [Gemmatimonadota bacterium]
MRIAIAGKGGSGKTTISGTMARLMGRRGLRVVAIDGDTNPNLAQSLGVTAGTSEELVALPGDLLVRKEDPNADPPSELKIPIDEVLDRYGTPAPDGVRLLVMGKVEHAGRGCKCRAHSVARYVIADLLEYANGDRELVVDMEAGLEHLSRGTTRHVDVLLAVAEPYYRSLETARRVYELAQELGIDQVRLVANKVRDAAESEAIRTYAERHGLELLAEIPHDEAVLRADLDGRALLDAAGTDSPAVREIDRLAGVLLAGAGL